MADITVTVHLDTTEALEKVAILNIQVDRLLSKLEKCNGLCDGCKITAEGNIKGADLVNVMRNHEYGQARTQ